MSRTLDYAKEGAKKGALVGAAIHGILGFFPGGPFGLIVGAISGAISWGIIGGIVGGLYGSFETSKPAPATTVVVNPTPNAGVTVASPALSPEQAQAVAYFQNQETARQQAAIAAAAQKNR